MTVEADDFVSLDDSGLLGPRNPDGSLPVTDFLRLAPGSDLIDAGIDMGLEFNGTAPDWAASRARDARVRQRAGPHATNVILPETPGTFSTMCSC